MAGKPIKTTLTIQLPAGKATAAPPVGTALGPHGINIGDFVKRYNEVTGSMSGEIVPVFVTIYEDRSFSLEFKTPPVSDMIRKALKVQKGSGNPLKNKIGKLTKAQLRQIAEAKLQDLNANDIESAEKIVAGTARSMGVDVEK